MGLQDFDSATRMRDVITLVARQVIDSARPAPTYGTVSAIDRAAKKVTVSFPGEGSNVKISMNSVQPNSVGQVVRIEGTVGDRYMTDVIGPSGSSWLDAAVVNTGSLVASGNLTALTVFVTGGSAEYRFYARSDATKYFSWFASSGTSAKLFSSNANKNVFGISDIGQAWISRNGHGLDVNGDIAAATNNALVVASNAGNNGATWNNCQLNLRSADVGGDASLSLYCSNYATAPIMRNYGAFGEIIDFVNNTNTANITIRAAAFTVSSSARFKTNIRLANPLLVGDRTWPKWSGATKRLQPKLWKKFPTMLTTGHAHVCGEDCDKTPQNPCPIGFEDQRDHMGFVAEEVAVVLPEAVTYDLDGSPLAIDYVALTAALWGAVAELTDRIEILEARSPALKP